MTILIVTNPERDSHILGAINELQYRGHQIFTFNPGKLPVEGKISIEASKTCLRRELTVEEHFPGERETGTERE